MNNTNNIQNKLIVIVGPTAVGKSAMAVEVAQTLGCEIISADSRQIYKEMSIGTDKPAKDEMGGIKHYFIDKVHAWEDYDAGLYEKDALEVIEGRIGKNGYITLVGGSGLFVRAVCEGLDPMPPKDLNVRRDLISEFELNGIGALTNELKIKDPEYYSEVDLLNPQRVIRALEVIRSSGKRYSGFRYGYLFCCT